MLRNRLSLLLALLLACPALAVAEDMAPGPTEAQALVARLEAAKAGRDNETWISALGGVGAVWEAADEADKKLLATTVGHGLKAKDEGVQIAAVQAFVATKDGEASWKAGLKGALPDAKTEVATPPQLRALEAMKVLHPEGAVTVLLTLVQKCKDVKASAAALVALGGYERSKQRVTILNELIQSLRNAMPSRSSSGVLSKSPRWDEMGPVAVPALNELTGRKEGDFTTWLQLYDENKKKPQGLFVNPLD